MDNSNEQQLLTQLRKIWLHDTDAEIYLTSLRLGACTIRQLTEQTNIHRVTVHDAVARLIANWLLLETYSGKKRLVFPQQITNLQHLVERKKAEVDQLQQDVSATMQLLQSVHLQAEYLPHIRITKWRAGITSMINEMTQSRASEIRVMSDSRHFDELVSVHFLDSVTKARPAKQLRMILPDGFEHFLFSAKAKWVSIESSSLDPSVNRKWWMTIRDDTVALHAYEWLYITTTIITNQPIVQMMKSCFEQFWLRS